MRPTVRQTDQATIIAHQFLHAVLVVIEVGALERRLQVIGEREIANVGIPTGRLPSAIGDFIWNDLAHIGLQRCGDAPLFHSPTRIWHATYGCVCDITSSSSYQIEIAERTSLARSRHAFLTPYGRKLV